MNLKLLFSIKKNLAVQYEDILIEYFAFILVQISFDQTISLRQLVPRLIKYPSLWETVQHWVFFYLSYILSQCCTFSTDSAGHAHSSRLAFTHCIWKKGFLFKSEEGQPV